MSYNLEPLMTYTVTANKRETRFIDGYIEAIYFTDTGDMHQPESDTDLDSDFLRESISDCLAFCNHNLCYLSDNQLEQAGHDFWLTRNGHGTGFWDSDSYGEHYSRRFTQIARNFGEVSAIFDE